MSFKHVDLESALRRLAERRIEDAMKEGKFDNLPGRGKPVELDPAPAEESARLLWWALRILRQNNVTPDEVQWRKSIELLKGELAGAREERQVRLLVARINAMVYKLNTLGTNAISSPVAGVDLKTELARLREREAEVPPPGRL